MNCYERKLGLCRAEQLQMFIKIAIQQESMIVSKNLSEPIRSHKDLDKDSAPYYHKAVKSMKGLSKQLVHQGHVLDLFACALDQGIIGKYIPSSTCLIRAAYKGFADTIRLLLFRDAYQGRKDKEDKIYATGHGRLWFGALIIEPLKGLSISGCPEIQQKHTL